MSRVLGSTLGGFALVVAAAAMTLAAPPAQAASVPGNGYVAAVSISSDLNCSADVSGQGSAFAGGAACGTLVSAHGRLLQPSSLSIPGSSGSIGTPWSPLSQSTSGSGAPGDPFVIQTVVTGSNVRLTQTDRFVAGEASYQTTYQLVNTGTSGTSTQLYHVASCAFAGSGTTYGEYDPNLRLVSCRKPAADGSYSVKTAGTQVAGIGAHFYYGTGSDFWAVAAARTALPDSVTPGAGRAVDGVLGLSWDKWLDAGQTATFTMRTVFQPEVYVPPPPEPPAPPNPPASSTRPGGNQSTPDPANQIVGQTTEPSDAPADDSPNPTDSPSPSARPSPSATPTATAAPSAPPLPEPGNGPAPIGPWLLAGVALLSIGGAAAILVLRRHGQPG